ncbi:MAG TPA: hypothetical protein VIF62_36175, partial [Labilithrix sp.]
MTDVRAPIAILAASFALACACANGSNQDTAQPPQTSGDDGGGAPIDGGADGSIAVPTPTWTPPTKLTDRIGVYAYGFDDSALAMTPDRLTWAAGKVHELGSSTMRVYLGPSDPYRLGLDPSASPVEIARSPAFSTLFASGSFDTFILDVYSKDDETSSWLTGYTPAAAMTERAAIADLATYLFQTYQNKTFILANTRGDDAIASYATDAGAWDGFVSWTQARADGVKDARLKAQSTSTFVFSAVEFNRVAGCDEAANKCVSSWVLPRVDVDFFSYASWASTGAAVADVDLATHLKGDLDTALAFAKKRDPKIDASRFMLGEMGAAREDYGECRAAQRIATIAQTATSWGAPFAVFWQILDEKPKTTPGATTLRYGAYRPDLTQTLPGSMLASLYTNDAPLNITATCPSLNPNGVGDGVTFAPPLHAEKAASLFALGLTSKSVVRLAQRDQSFTLTDGSPYWYRS